jgi:hypothetical protein
MARSTDEQIIGLLEQLVRVQALQVAQNRSVTEGARLLKQVGLDNQTIALVMNTSPAVIRTVTSNLFSSGRAVKKKKKGG